MMKRSILALCSTLLTTLALSSVARADQQADWQEIKNRYQARLTYMCQGAPFDINQIFASYAPNWTSIDENGDVKNLDIVRSGLENFHEHQGYFTKCSQTNYITATDGQIFQVRYDNEHFTRLYSTNQNMDMFYVPMRTTSLIHDTWAKTPGGWRLVSTTILKSNSSQGQPQAIDPYLNDTSKIINSINQGAVLRDLGLQNWSHP